MVICYLPIICIYWVGGLLWFPGVSENSIPPLLRGGKPCNAHNGNAADSPVQFIINTTEQISSFKLQEMQVPGPEQVVTGHKTGHVS